MGKKLLSILLATLLLAQCLPYSSPAVYAQDVNENFVAKDLIHGEQEAILYEAAATVTPLKITTQPASVAVPNGATAKVTVSAQGDGLTYKWYYKSKGESKYSLTNSFKGKSYSVTMNSARNGRKIYCVITDKHGVKVQTRTVTISMDNTLKITKQPVSVTAKKNATAKVTVSAQGDGLTYKWYYKNAGAKKFTRTTTFKGNTYSVKMTAARSGRQIYCVISDRHGKTVKTNTVKLNMGTPLKITKQPVNVAATDGATAKITVSAQGDGLTYKWYYKNVGKSKFSLTTTFKGNTYSLAMNKSRDGRQIYCKITDKYGNTLQTNTVALTLEHTYDQGTVTKQPTCTLPGEMVYVCTVCSKEDVRSVKALGHDMSDWAVFKDTTAAAEGIERSTCSRCNYYIERSIEKLDPVCYITVDLGQNESYKVPVGSNGKYYLTNPAREGYTFNGWQHADGSAFESNGTVDANVTIKAIWGVQGTNTLSQLIKRAEKGVKDIEITSNIVVTQPIFISHETNIYANADYSITRDPNYNGDIFVVGQDKNGNNSVTMHRKAVLTLGGGQGLLTIDGNKDAMNVDVVGSAVFTSFSSTLNLYDGVRIANNIKKGNKRIYTCSDFAETSTMERVGGAAIVNINAHVNMYGGIIENNIVSTEYTVITNDAGVQESKEINGCGGAVYNKGNFNMYGGTIANSEALRGGGIYTDRIVYLFAGTIEGNLSHTYGGALSSSSASNADIFIGSENGNKTMLFRQNHSMRAGGALYSNTCSPIIIYGNTVFEDNETDSSGGAIYTAGPLTIRGADFRGNDCIGSGGAIYHHYTNPDYERRLISLTDCNFENNSGNLGGAVILSASDAVAGTGTSATITDCNFKGNQAVAHNPSQGNGGAIYITRDSIATIKGCTFTENTAANNAGAVAVHSNANIKLPDCEFVGNTAKSGGAVYASSNAKVDMSNLLFEENKAVKDAGNSGGNGGAIYLYEATLTIKDIDFYNNSADQHGGAVYQGVSPLTVDSTCEFVGNSAGSHGGAFYLTYKTLADGTKAAAVLKATDVVFKDHTAAAGGVISIRTGCEANLKNVTLKDNSVSGTEYDASGGGAIYVGFGKLTMDNVTATGNTSAGYGGAVNALAAEVSVTGGSFQNNSAEIGGAINAYSKCTLTIEDTQMIQNESTYVNSDYNSSKGGGALFVSGGTLSLKDITLDGNTSQYYGGALLISGATVSIEGESVVKNSVGATGAALYFKGGSNVTIKDAVVTGNNSNGNGVIYQNGGTLDLSNITATDNTAGSGGVLFVSGASTKVTLKDSTLNKNTANNGGTIHMTNASVDITNCQFKENTSTLGGAIYNKTAVLTLKDIVFTDNTATKTSSGSNGNGGAIYLTGSELDIDNTITLNNNSAENHGGAIYVSYVTNETDNSKIPAILNVNNASFENNSAMGGGAISIRTNCAATLNNVTLTGNSVSGFAGEEDGDGEGGGAIYVGYGELTLNKVTASGNTSDTFGGVVDAAGATVNITDCRFTDNKAATGGALNAITQSTVNIKDTDLLNNESTFVNTTSNTDKGGGAIKAYNSTLTLDHVQLEGNKSNYYGGALLSSKSTVNILNNSTIQNSTGATGAALYFKYSSTATIKDAVLNDNTASSNGVIYCNSSSLNIENVPATRNKAYNGGILYVSNANSKVTVKSSDWSGNTATNGGAVYIADATVEINDCVITENTAILGGAIYDNGTLKLKNVTLTDNKANKNTSGSGGNGGAIYLLAKELTFDQSVTLKNNSAENHGGAIYLSYTKDDVNKVNIPAILTVNGGTIENNTAMGGGAISIRTDCVATLNDVTLKNNSVTGFAGKDDGDGEGGGAIYVGYGALTLNRVTATNNTSSAFGGAVDAVASNVTITDSTFEQNNAVTGAAIHSMSKSTVIVNNTQFIGNDVSGNGVVYQNGGTLEMTKVTATENTATSTGGALNVTNDANVTIKESTFIKNTAAHGGAIYNYNSTINLQDTTFNENHTIQGKGGNGGAIYIGGGTVSGTGNNQWIGNSTENHAGAIYVSYLNNEDGSKKPGVLNLEGGSFTENSSVAGGAISSRTSCEVTLNGTVLKNNVATSNASDLGGGAIFTNNNTLTLSDALIEGNSTAYYGGGITSLGANVTIKDNTVFKGNIGITGPAIHVRNGGQLIMNQVSVTDHVATAGSGVIYITSNGSADITKLTATNNQNNNGGVLYISGSVKVDIKESTLTNNTALSFGGAIDHRSSGALTITDSTITNNNAKNGGAIYSNGSGTVTVKNSTVDQNTATEIGGGIHATGKGLISILDNTAINTNSATTAGGIYLDKGATATIVSSTLDANKATAGDGGAIVVADSSKSTDEQKDFATGLTMTGVTLKNNTASSKGGALSTDTASVNLVINATDCTFLNNSALGAGGGAVEIQNQNQPNATDPAQTKLVFKNCTFTGNNAKSTGGAIEIRTSSHAKFDGITATKNTAKENGGVIYLTSNYSRLYLTGTITASENTAKNGTFAYLYNNNYTNPPRIYTTHSSSADWYKDVKGNTSSVTFDLTTLP